MNQHQQILQAIATDRQLAHSILFKHRHPLATPEFHATMIDDFHGHDDQIVLEAFRGGGKSTIGEEGMTIMSMLTDFNNGVIVSSTEKRAAERLEAIKHEIDNNDSIIELFGSQVGDVWQAHKAVLSSGVCLQALGVGQAVRGIKHHEFRPDFLWIDDIEDEESVRTPEASHERLKWLFGTLLPVCAKNARIRVTGNRLSPDAVVTKLANSPNWRSRRFPISYTEVNTGKETATWHELFDMGWIEQKRREYFDLGLSQVWASEYMCEAISESVKPFKPENYRIVPRTRTFEPVNVMYDPAKTNQSKRHQAHYGKAVFSWVGQKLIVWEAWAKPIMPSELIDDIFKTDKDYNPVSIAVEADGLEEWLHEPLRIEQSRRRIFLPHLRSERAPRDKDSFIRSLQPFFIANQVEFANDCPEARSQLLNFPAGRKDLLNALAYAMKLRPGQLVYDAFSQEFIQENIDAHLRAKTYLCINADGTQTTAALVQYDGTLAVLADWIEAGEPAQCLEAICKQASLIGGAFEVVVPPKEADQYQNKGVIAALRRLPRSYKIGNQYEAGRAEIRDLIAKRSARPLLLVSSTATWTLRAMTGGYHKVYNQKGLVEGEAQPGAYRTLMEGLESFAGMMQNDAEDEGLFGGLFRTSKNGQTYRSLIGHRKDVRDTKHG